MVGQTTKFNRCVKSVRRTVKSRRGSNKESAAIAICTKTILHPRGRTIKRYRKGRLTTQRKRRGGALMPRPPPRMPEQSAASVIASIVEQTAPEKARPHRVITPGGQDAGIQGLEWTVVVNKSDDTSKGIMDIVKRLRDRKDAKTAAAEDAGWWARAKMAVKSKFPSDTEYLIDLLNTLASEGTTTMTAMEHATIQKLTNKLRGLYAPPSALPSSA
jgi:hypothetical protein